MKKLFAFTALLALLAGITGCGKGGGSTATTKPGTPPAGTPQASKPTPPAAGGHEAVMKEMTKGMNDMADAMESIKDDASADAAIAKMEKIGAQLKETADKANALKEPTADEQKKLESQKAGLDKAGDRIKTAGEGLAKTKASPEKQMKVAEAMTKTMMNMKGGGAPPPMPGPPMPPK